MTRLINIEDAALLKTVADGGLSAKALWRRINAQPTIDAVPVTRCKDCRWGREVCGNIECNFDVPEYHGYDWYCANGDKKNGQQGNDIHKNSQMARIG